MSENKLIGHESYLEKFVTLYENNELPNKILLTGKKGIGKSFLAKKFLKNDLKVDISIPHVQVEGHLKYLDKVMFMFFESIFEMKLSVVKSKNQTC